MSNTNLSPLEKQSNQMLRIAGICLVATVWISAMLFGLYILAFYAVALFQGNETQWNEVLPGLYDPKTPSATIGIGVHFAAGGIILMLGCIQMMEIIRQRYLNLHRWLGRIYIVASIFAGVGGLIFIFVKGTIGGTTMDIGFSLYGLLMILAAILTAYFARKKQMDQHRAWGIRLFALAIGSWLYRMDYGFWFLLTDRFAHTDDFTGGFDQVMAFFFYIPNLIVAEFFIGKIKVFNNSLLKIIAALLIFGATAFLFLGTFFFFTHLWGPAIRGLFASS